MAALIGLLVTLAWVGTGFVLQDDFDPVPLQSLGFTGPMADTLFWTMAATAMVVSARIVGRLLAEGPTRTGS